MSGPATADYVSLIRGETTVMDVRAPEEFSRGAIARSVNLPILNDDERARVGTCYKHEGQAAAIELGHRLVSGATKTARIQAWAEIADAHPDAAICCWRGGLRSTLAQQWLAESGRDVPRVIGGYKALRHVCMETLPAATSRRWVVVSGRTGTGKTHVIHALTNAIDLEGLANHRGSAFGARSTPQPAPATFENHLAAEILAHDDTVTIALEDESRTIGRLGLPQDIFEAMQRAPIVILEASLDERISNIYAEYVIADQAPERLFTALDRIKKRLGGQRHLELTRQMREAFEHADEDRHRAWIRQLLSDYYDPMYDYQIEKKKGRSVFAGQRSAIVEFLQTFEASPR